MLSWFREQHVPRVEERGAVLDPVALLPKLSVRIPEEMHTELKVKAAMERTTVQALVVEALVDRLKKPKPPPKPKAGDQYRSGPNV